MSNSPVIIPSDEIARLVQQRSEIWQTVDETRNQAQRVEELGRNLGDKGTASSLPALADGNNPRAEIFSVHQQLKEELDRIAEANSAIQQHEESIKKLQSQRQTMIAIASIMAVIFICVFLGMVA